MWSAGILSNRKLLCGCFLRGGEILSKFENIFAKKNCLFGYLNRSLILNILKIHTKIDCILPRISKIPSNVSPTSQKLFFLRRTGVRCRFQTRLSPFLLSTVHLSIDGPHNSRTSFQRQKKLASFDSRIFRAKFPGTQHRG